MLKRILFIAAFALCIVYAKRFCYRHTDGFALNKILSNLSYHSEWEVPVSTQENEVLSLIDQPFHYLAKGAQSYVFVSEDGQTVVKFFRLYHLLPPLWIKMLHFPPKMQLFKLRKMLAKREELEKDFDSYLLAYQQMREETGLLYVHLNKTSHLKQKITLYDRLNIAHTLDLNTTGFLLQKRVDLVYPFLKEKIKSGNLQEAEEAISSLINLFFWKYRHSIGDNDPLIRTNYGFLSGKAIQIDVGPLSIDNSLTAKELQENEARRTTASLKHWLEENCPELIPFLDRELESQLSWKDEKTPDLPFCPSAADRIATAD